MVWRDVTYRSKVRDNSFSKIIFGWKTLKKKKVRCMERPEGEVLTEEEAKNAKAELHPQPGLYLYGFSRQSFSM